MNLLLSLLVAYILVLALIRVFESRLIFFPNYPGRLAGDWTPHGLPVQDVWLTTSDSVKLHAWWIPHEDAKYTFVAFHGNARNIADRASVYEFLRSSPANVLAVEYRGYGRSEGNPSEAGLYRDAEAGFEYLILEKGIAPQRIISFGQSLGTAVAAHLVAQHAMGGVVLEAPFPSASRMARRAFWFLPGLGLLVYSQFDTLERLKLITAPILIVHCAQDPVIPFQFGQEVYDAAHTPKSFVEISGSCHEEASVIAPVQYQNRLRVFLEGLDRKAGN